MAVNSPKTEVNGKDAVIPSAAGGLQVQACFCPAGQDPLESVKWERRTAIIKDDKGEVIFRQEGVEVPASWSQLATNVVVNKYFYGEHGKKERENSVRQLVHRVTRTIADWALQDGLLASPQDADNFYRDLTWLCVHQYGAFNSPVWFNVGLFHQKGVAGSEGNFHWDRARQTPVRTKRGYEYPQGSACFIQSVADTMEDIMRLATSEAMLFKYGSGTGTDLSTLRSSRERLAGGGKPSGPMSFMRVFDQIAGVVKSGGKTRRAAKMQSLRCDHPDIMEFIQAKANEEKKAWALIEAGYDGNYNGEAYSSVMYQNANLSVRLTDDFLQAAVDGKEWQTYAVTTKEPMVKYDAAEMLRTMADSCNICGDPGVQYDTTINRWHTCPESGRINASNPCSEYMFVNDSACNLSSLNLMKFRQADGRFDVDSFRKAVRIFVIAQEMLVDHGSYPTEKICSNSHLFRPLGLGYANLGAMLMSLGYPYDSDAGRATAAAVTAILTAEAYTTSAEMASRLGTFDEFPKNRQSMLKVMRMHRAEIENIQSAELAGELVDEARRSWDKAVAAGESHGYRNAQATVLAPTGTIGFMMDCDTTGVEPDIALVKYKLLAGGGMLKLVNNTVGLALERMGYSPSEVDAILDHIEQQDTIEGAAGLHEEDLAVFDCAFRPAKGVRSIHYSGHLRMMAAVQPFLSGAISKTVNMPKETTTEEISDVFLSGWRMGLKAVAIYRDGSKRSQPLNVKQDKKKSEPVEQPAVAALPVAPAFAPRRQRMPATAMSVRHKFEVGGHEGYLHVGLFNDQQPGEVFITMAKEGSTVGGMMDAFATAISLCLQYGVPLEALVKKFSHQRFEPNGMTSNTEIPFAKSIVDYIFRWLGMEFSERKNEQSFKRPGRLDRSAAGEGVTDESAPDAHGAAGTAGKDVSIPGAGAYVSHAASEDGNGSGKAAVAAVTAVNLENRLSGMTRIDEQFSHFQEDAPACDVCGSITVRNGSCYKCFNCGASLGCS